MVGWIKLHRSILKWEWYEDKNALIVLVHLLVTVNYEDKKWKGILINAGSRVASWKTLKNELPCMSLQQIRTAVHKLFISGEITRTATNKYQIITLVKWDKLQSNELLINNQNNNEITNEQQTNNKQITTTKEDNNINFVNKRSIEERKREFYNSLIPFLSDYPEKMILDFFSYWSEHGENDKKFRKEKEKSFEISRRLKTWHANQLNWEKEKKVAEKKEKQSASEILRQKYGII